MDDFDPDATTENPDNEFAPARAGLDNDTCDGLTCPRCGTDAMWYWVSPGPRHDGCHCDECGHEVALLDYLLGVGLAPGDVEALALVPGAGGYGADA